MPSTSSGVSLAWLQACSIRRSFSADKASWCIRWTVLTGRSSILALCASVEPSAWFTVCVRKRWLYRSLGLTHAYDQTNPILHREQAKRSEGMCKKHFLPKMLIWRILRGVLRPSRFTACSEWQIGQGYLWVTSEASNVLSLSWWREHYEVVVLVIRAVRWYTGVASVISFSCCLVGLTTIQDLQMFFHFYPLLTCFGFQSLILGLSQLIKVEI